MIGRVWFGLLTKTAQGDHVTQLDPYADYGLIMGSYDAPPPQPKIYRANIEGRNGTLDMSEWAGEIFYGDRTVTIMLRDMHGSANANAFVNRVTGRRCRMWFDDDPDYFYEGRCEKTATSTRQHVTDITLTLTCHPFRYPRVLDDYAPGIDGVAYSGHRAPALTAASGGSSTATWTLHQAEKSVMTAEISGYVSGTSGCKLTVNGTNYTINANGKMASSNVIELLPGPNAVKLTNTGSATLTALCMFADKVI